MTVPRTERICNVCVPPGEMPADAGSTVIGGCVGTGVGAAGTAGAAPAAGVVPSLGAADGALPAGTVVAKGLAEPDTGVAVGAGVTTLGAGCARTPPLRNAATHASAMAMLAATRRVRALRERNISHHG